ncbi:MAG: DMT family transporter [Betaproteobacteria bacterium]
MTAAPAEDVRRDWKGAALVICSAMAFSAKAIFVKLAYSGGSPGFMAPDPITLLTMRMGLALPLFALIAWWSSRQAENALDRREWAILVVIGLMGYYGASLFDFWGLMYISAALERLILFLNPTLVVLISVVAVGYRIVGRDIFALAVSYAGIALVFVHDLNLNPDKVLLGGGLVLLSAILYAGYLVGAGQMIKRVGSIRFAAYASIVSTLAIFLHFIVSHDISQLSQQSSRVWTLSGWMAVVSTVLPVIMMAAGMRRVGSSNAAMMSSIGPIATIFMGYVFLDEKITLIQIAGAALVLTGVLAISLKKK